MVAPPEPGARGAIRGGRFFSGGHSPTEIRFPEGPFERRREGSGLASAADLRGPMARKDPREAAERAAEALRQIGALLQLEKGNAFKVQAYRRAADVVATVPDVEALAEAGRLTSIPGVGAGIARVLGELLRTGSSALLEGLR